MRHSIRMSGRPWTLLAGLFALVACERATAPDPASPASVNQPSFATAAPGGVVALPFVANADVHAVYGSAPINCSANSAGIGYTVPSQYVGQGPSRFLGMSTATVTFVACAVVLRPEGNDILVFTSTGTVTTVAANGDELRGTFTTKHYASGAFVSQSATISGGTGRFANASGDLSMTGWLDRTTLVGYWTITGTISRPNS